MSIVNYIPVILIISVVVIFFYYYKVWIVDFYIDDFLNAVDKIDKENADRENAALEGKSY